MADTVALAVPLIVELLGAGKVNAPLLEHAVALAAEILNVYLHGRPSESGK